MLNNISNFFNLVKARRIKNTLEPKDLIAIGIRDRINKSDYQPAAITYEDLENQIGGVQSVTGLNTDNTDPNNPVINIAVDGVTITGSGTIASPLTTGFQVTTINITSLQILGLSTPIELLPAPGIDKYYVIDRIEYKYTFNTLPYTLPSSPTLYLDGCFDSYIDKTLLTSATNAVCVINGNLRNTITVGSGSGAVKVITNKDVLNSNLILGTTNGENPFGGDGTIQIIIYYKIQTF